MSATASCYRPTYLDVDQLEAEHGGYLSIGEWEELLRGLGAMATGHQWWIGDALVYGETHFEEHAYLQHVDALGLAEQTMLNYRWCAAAVAPSRRREELTWSHHAEVARLEPELQEKLLAEAIAESWNVRQLRDAVAVRHPDPRASTSPARPPGAELSDAEEAAIARRLESLRDGFEHWQEDGFKKTTMAKYFDRSDIGWMLDTIRFLTRGGARPA